VEGETIDDKEIKYEKIVNGDQAMTFINKDEDRVLWSYLEIEVTELKDVKSKSKVKK
jgi:dsDNA-binding SOS-regulon protein